MPQPGGRPREVGAVHGVPITNEIRRRASPRGRVDHLAPDPLGGRMGCHRDVDQLPPAVRGEDQDVERAERQRVDGEHIGRPDAGSMVGQEGPPGLTRRTIRAVRAVAPDRAVADHDAELEQLAADPLGAPQDVVARHRPDQVLCRGAQARPSTGRARPPAPEQSPSPPMPPDHRVGRDQDQVPAPVGAAPAAEQPEQLVPDPERRASSRASGDRQLVTQEQVLKNEVAAAAEHRGDDAQQEGDQFEQREVLPSDNRVKRRDDHARSAIERAMGTDELRGGAHCPLRGLLASLNHFLSGSFRVILGADGRIRTLDLLLTNQPADRS
jgi:hypothetical protein